MMLIFLKYMLTFDLQAHPPPPHIPPSLALIQSTTLGCQWPGACGECAAVTGQGHMLPVLSASPFPPAQLPRQSPGNCPGLSGLHDILPRVTGPCFHPSVWGYLASFLQHKHWLRPQRLSVNLSSVCYQLCILQARGLFKPQVFCLSVKTTTYLLQEIVYEGSAS